MCIRDRVKSVQNVAVGVLGSADVVAFVVEEFSGTAEQRVVSADVQTVCVVDFQRFYTLAVLLSVRIDGDFG